MEEHRMGLTSIIILNWNGMKFTRPCIQSVHKNTAMPFEIIAIDNGSKQAEIEELRQMLKKGFINRLIENKANIGFAAANNQGMRQAKGDYIFLLNNDTIVPKNWLKEITKIAESDKTIGIVGTNLPASSQDKNVYYGARVSLNGSVRYKVEKKRQGMKEIEVDQVGGAALLIKRKAFEAIGELDQGFSPIYFEETDYCARARKADFKVIFTPNVEIIHFGSEITKKQPGKWMYVVLKKNRVRYMLLHFPWWKLLLAIPFEAGRILKSILEMKLHWLLEAYWLNLRCLGEIMKKRIRYRKGNVKVLN